MSIIEEKCKQKGVRLTDQRKVIAKVLSESKEVYGSKDHPDVDELHKRATLIDKKISIATVYRTIKLFEESGILIRHDFKEGKSRYEPTTEEHHNHLIDINSGCLLYTSDAADDSLRVDLGDFNLKNIELLIKKNLIQNKLIKPIYLS